MQMSIITRKAAGKALSPWLAAGTWPSDRSIAWCLAGGIASGAWGSGSIWLQRSTQHEFRDCCFWILWRHGSAAVLWTQLARLAAWKCSALTVGSHQQEKLGVGAWCVYINTDWLVNAVLISSYCRCWLLDVDHFISWGNSPPCSYLCVLVKLYGAIRKFYCHWRFHPHNLLPKFSQNSPKIPFQWIGRTCGGVFAKTTLACATVSPTLTSATQIMCLSCSLYMLSPFKAQ